MWSKGYQPQMLVSTRLRFNVSLLLSARPEDYMNGGRLQTLDGTTRTRQLICGHPRERKTGKAMDIVGWTVIGLLAAVTGEFVIPGRNPGGITVTLIVGSQGCPSRTIPSRARARYRSDGIRHRVDPVGNPGNAHAVDAHRLIASLRRKSQER
jgi:hypothetical protein